MTVRTTPLILGLDTGGTHTDAVVYDPRPGRVLATAKALTTHHDLSIGLIGALRAISGLKWPGGLAAIGRVNLSTTLATNAVAEGLGGRIGLVLIGCQNAVPDTQQMFTKTTVFFYWYFDDDERTIITFNVCTIKGGYNNDRFRLMVAIGQVCDDGQQKNVYG